jgi:glycosyltransferase involved in cell wall biosynthesis
MKPPVEEDSIAIWTYQVARRIAETCDVVVYSPQPSGMALPSTCHEGVSYRYIPMSLDRLVDKGHGLALRLRGMARVSWPASRLPRFGSVLHHLCYGLRVARELRREQFDIVHIHNFTQLVPIIRYLNPGIRIVLHMHCQWLTQLDRDVVARRLGRVDSIVGCSDFITDKVRRAFPEAARKCRTIYNGVDTTRYLPVPGSAVKPQDEKRIVFVGRISPEKGIHVLLDAFRRVVAVEPCAKLLLVGPALSAPRDYIVSLAQDSEVTDLAAFYPAGAGLAHYFDLMKQRLDTDLADIAQHVAWLGTVPHSALGDIYAGATVFVGSSLSEAFNMPVIEAMACGAPVAATRVGGTPEAVIDRVTGIIVPPGDAAALGDALCRLLADPEMRRSMGHEGRRRALEHFSWDRIASAVVKAYEDLATTRRAARA